ncbi:MAG: hypothetical protein QOK28_2708 [Actinomycetota bacterium]|jgi:hypothetical protein
MIGEVFQTDDDACARAELMPWSFCALSLA